MNDRKKIYVAGCGGMLGEAFYSVFKETQDTTGLTLPHHIEAYVVMLLASKVDQPDFLPNGTFAESYIKKM